MTHTRTPLRLALALGLLLAGGAQAGSLTPPAAPDNPGSAMFTLEDLYQRLDSGAPGALRTGPFVAPTAGPGSTGHTLNEAMGKAPALDDANGAMPADVPSGKTFWGLKDSAWGPQTGTMPNVGAQSITPGVAAQSIGQGYHDGTGSVAGDADLSAGNIRSGVNIFGIDGSVLQATGAATAAQVLTGVTFSNASGAATGTMPNIGAVTITPGTAAQAISAGYHNGSGSVAGDADLAAGNIVSGVQIFGVTGTASVGGGGATAAVPKTGQTTSYSATGGEDGDLQKGVAWPSPRFTDNANGTVTDNLTALIWLKNANCFGARTWEQALANANALANGQCTLTDGSTAGQWRLPNVREQQSLIDYGRVNPALPTGHPFSGVQTNNYWSATTYAYNTSNAWIVLLNYGNVLAGGKTSSYYVWPVRGGQ